MKTILLVLGIIFANRCNCQECEMYAVDDIPVYLHLVATGKSTNKWNDSTSYTLEKIGIQRFRVEKLLNEKIVDSWNCVFAGKKDYHHFKVRKLTFKKSIVVKHKKMVCTLDKEVPASDPLEHLRVYE